MRTIQTVAEHVVGSGRKQALIQEQESDVSNDVEEHLRGVCSIAPHYSVETDFQVHAATEIPRCADSQRYLCSMDSLRSCYYENPVHEMAPPFQYVRWTQATICVNGVE